MIEILTLSGFCACLILCILSGWSILWALASGFVIFLCYGRGKGHSFKELFGMAFSGIRTVKNILLLFFLIGILTAVWRAGGTIPTIICVAASLIRPSLFYLLTFLLNCGVSVLTGTSFGSAATMGVVCMTMGMTMELNPVFIGGAVMSGIFFGDRWSPVSTSALLVCELTETDIFTNLRKMLRTAWLPFLLSCGIYMVMGYAIDGTSAVMDVRPVFEREFSLHWFTVVPAVMIIFLSMFRVNVKWTMLISIMLAVFNCLWIQQVPFWSLCKMAVWGYQSSDPEISVMLNGGGLFSMVRVGVIVCLSSTYAGLFRGTGLLNGLKLLEEKLSKRCSPFGAIVCTAIVSSAIACNQTLAIMLTDQLCRELEPDGQTLAIDLEDSVVVIAPLVPWSIAGAVPLTTIAAPTTSLFCACFLYLLPLIKLMQRRWDRYHE